MRNALFEPEVAIQTPVKVLVASKVPLKGFIFPVDFEGSVGNEATLNHSSR